jgi:transcription termination factor NusB
LSAGAYADLLLHSALGRSSLNAPDRAFATDLVYGTLRWRGKIDYYLSHFVEQDLAKLEPLVASTLQLGAYQLLFTERVPVSAAVDQSVRCIRAAGASRATGLVNAVLRRLSLEHDKIALPSVHDDPIAHLTHALSLPRWLAERWIERFGVEDAVALAKACNEPPPLTIRTNRARADAAELLQDLLESFPNATACRFARDGIVLGRKGNPARDQGTATSAGSISSSGRCGDSGSLGSEPSPGMRRTPSQNWRPKAASTGSSWMPPARGSVRSAATPTQNGGSDRETRRAWPRSSGRSSTAPPRC